MSRIRNFFKTKMWVKIIVLGVPLVLIGYLVWVFVVTPVIRCGPEVKRIDDQCIGVTNGQVTLRPDLAEVLDRIQQENDQITQENPDAEVVSIAYLVPFPKESTEDDGLRHELQGAHIAQLQANRTSELGDRPLIRLLVANSGEQSSQWKQVVPALLAKINNSDRLVAVVATGNTVNTTLDSITALRSGGLPVVLSRISGDSLLDQEGQVTLKGGLARLAPSGRDQGAAAAAYLRHAASSALIVRDTNPEDPYLQAFEEEFRKYFPDDGHAILEPPETYDSRLDGVANRMQKILRNICVQKPEAVFFAGRAPEMDAFIQALPRRPCSDLPINIMAADGGVNFSVKVADGDAEPAHGLKSNASLRYTAQAHPDSWESSPASFQSNSMSRLNSSCDYCFITVFRGETLTDGAAIVGYDAIVTAVTAIRPGEENVVNDTPELVSQELKGLHGQGAVPGAAGWISLDQYGNPVNKAVAILEVKPDGNLEFLELTSPLGSPCVPDLSPC